MQHIYLSFSNDYIKVIRLYALQRMDGLEAKLPSAGLWLNASQSESMPERDDLLRHAVRGYEEAPPAPQTGTPLKRQPDVVDSLRAGMNPLQTTRMSDRVV